jgi:hypothetical protein
MGVWSNPVSSSVEGTSAVLGGFPGLLYHLAAQRIASHHWRYVRDFTHVFKID